MVFIPGSGEKKVNANLFAILRREICPIVSGEASVTQPSVKRLMRHRISRWDL